MSSAKPSFEAHPLAELFPLVVTGPSYEALKASIASFGQLDPIVVVEGRILDGRRRAHACHELGIEPKIREYANEFGDPLTFALVKNLPNRDHTSGQRAAIAVALLPELRKQAKVRQRQHGGTGPGKAQTSLPEKVRGVFQGEAVEEAARLCGTNAKYVRELNKIKENDPALFENVWNDEIELAAALKNLKSRNKPTKALEPPKDDQPAGSDPEMFEVAPGSEAVPQTTTDAEVKATSDANGARGKLKSGGMKSGVILGELQKASDVLNRLISEDTGKQVEELLRWGLLRTKQERCASLLKSLRSKLDRLESWFLNAPATNGQEDGKSTARGIAIFPRGAED